MAIHADCTPAQLKCIASETLRRSSDRRVRRIFWLDLLGRRIPCGPLSLADLLTHFQLHPTPDPCTPLATFFRSLWDFYSPGLLPSFMSRHSALLSDRASPRLPSKGSNSLSYIHTHPSHPPRDRPDTTGTTADFEVFDQDSVGAPQSQSQSLRKLAMSHLMGSAFSAPASPRIKANENGHSSENGHGHGPLPPPGAPALTNALNTLNAPDAVPPRIPNGPQYDSPYSRSISSTAPTSPRM
jgi:hypothetical protein